MIIYPNGEELEIHSTGDDLENCKVKISGIYHYSPEGASYYIVSRSDGEKFLNGYDNIVITSACLKKV